MESIPDWVIWLGALAGGFVSALFGIKFRSGGDHDTHQIKGAALVDSSAAASLTEEVKGVRKAIEGIAEFLQRRDEEAREERNHAELDALREQIRELRHGKPD